MNASPFLVWITLNDGSTTAREYRTRLGAVRAYNALRRSRRVHGFPFEAYSLVKEIGWRENTGALSAEVTIRRAGA
jgi:hypothetical protein